ncbi:MAG: hypothetical protein E6K78_07885 [Candidatus Eisenbacteria bacterium]|uniref:Uncharacterized protein n=1 Tax=Eiseniibacteriota bacterium TaxID=2212470 RepID=A0A538TNY6_UNCEI|nr:MAG: hypothetical protein E6K78_07885 [Candidatus Eisenbacteria bacterium]
MSPSFYDAQATVHKIQGLHRRATIATGVTMELGVHGPIKDFYRLSPERDLPLPVDYIVAATGG